MGRGLREESGKRGKDSDHGRDCVSEKKDDDDTLSPFPRGTG